jgi:hypothetical protein
MNGQVGGAKLVAWSVEDVFVTVAEELDLEDGIAVVRGTCSQAWYISDPPPSHHMLD